jgi:hypothetical protein
MKILRLIETLLMVRLTYITHTGTETGVPYETEPNGSQARRAVPGSTESGIEIYVREVRLQRYGLLESFDTMYEQFAGFCEHLTLNFFTS